jgi:hypothetical protein
MTIEDVPPFEPQFERLPDGRRVPVSRARVSAGREISPLGWQVQLSEPNERVFQRANALAAARFGDERSETILRMAQEAFRYDEPRHSARHS